MEEVNGMKQNGIRAKIVGTGSFVPDVAVKNKELTDIIGIKDAEWIYKNLGIEERRFSATLDKMTGQVVTRNITDIDLAHEAAIRAIQDARLSPEQINGLWYVSCTQNPEKHHHFSQAAIELHDRLGLGVDAFANEIDSGCGGVMQAIGISNDMIKGDDKANILIVASNQPSWFIDRELYVATHNWLSIYIFGDGAGAVLLQKAEKTNKGIVSSYYGADGSNPLMYYRYKDRGNHPVYEIDAKAVKDLFPVLMKRSLSGLRKKYRFELDEIKRFYFHQANRWILEGFAEFLEIPLERVAINVDKYGNLSAASTLVLLDEDIKEGRVKKGDLLLFCAVGAGAQYGAFLVRL